MFSAFWTALSLEYTPMTPFIEQCDLYRYKKKTSNFCSYVDKFKDRRNNSTSMSDLVENNMEHAEEYDEIYRWRDPHRQEEQLFRVCQLRDYMRYIRW